MSASAVSDKDEESEDMSVPGSPHGEAIQHSSVSTSNGVGSSSAAAAAAATSNQSTAGSPPRRGAAQAQPPGSWWSCSRAAPLGPQRAPTASLLVTFLVTFDEFVAFGSIFSAINKDKRTGTLGVGCKIHVFASRDLFVALLWCFNLTGSACLISEALETNVRPFHLLSWFVLVFFCCCCWFFF